MQLPGEPVRIRVDVSQTPGGALNVAEEPHKKPVAFWRGDDLRFEIGVFNHLTPVDLGNIGTLTVEVKDLHRMNGGPVMSKTLSGVSVVDTIGVAGWDAGTEQHAVVEFSGSETFLDLLGGPSREFWLTIYGETTDTTPKKVVFGGGKIFVFNSGAFSGLPVVTPEQPCFFSCDESDARYRLKTEDFFLFGDGVPAPTLGIDGDVYLDRLTTDVYKKIAGSWVFQVNVAGVSSGVSQITDTFTRETPLPVGEYLLGSPKYSVPMVANLARFTASAPVGTPSVLELEVNGTLTSVQVTVPSGSLGQEVTGEVVINEVIPSGQAARWKHVSGPGSPANFPSLIGLSMRVIPQ